MCRVLARMQHSFFNGKKYFSRHKNWQRVPNSPILIPSPSICLLPPPFKFCQHPPRSFCYLSSLDECVIIQLFFLLNDNMDPNLLNLVTLVLAAPCCLWYAQRIKFTEVLTKTQRTQTRTHRTHKDQ